MEKLRIPLDTGKTDPQINHIGENPDIRNLKKSSKKLLNKNHTVKGLEVKIQQTVDAKLMQQKRKTNTDPLTAIGRERNR